MALKFDDIDYLREKIEQCDDEEEEDSDSELQLAFEKGLLQKGLNVEYTKKQRELVNNVPALKRKLKEIELSLPWVEVLQVTSEPAPIAPEMAVKMDQMTKKPEMSDDFSREMYFYRLAQSAVLEAIPRLRALGILTRRPDDYFAQMSKTDTHMQKVRQQLTNKQNGMILSEKAKKLRELKKFGKKVEIEVKLKRQKERKDMLDDIKKFRKGKKDSLDFLNDRFDKFDKTEDAQQTKKDLRHQKDEIKHKRRQKDKKFGFGGKKRQLKRVTPKDIDDSFKSKAEKLKGKGNSSMGINRNMNKGKNKGKNRSQMRKKQIKD